MQVFRICRIQKHMLIRLRLMKLADFNTLREAMVQAYPGLDQAILREDHFQDAYPTLPRRPIVRDSERRGSDRGPVH